MMLLQRMERIRQKEGRDDGRAGQTATYVLYIVSSRDMRHLLDRYLLMYYCISALHMYAHIYFYSCSADSGSS